MAYHHVLITFVDSPDKPRCVLSDLSEQDLKTQFVTPYRKGKDILCGVEIIRVGSIKKVQIIRTNEKSEVERDIIYEQSLKRDQEFNRQSDSVLLINLGHGYEPEDIAEAGEDVTSQYIFGPPGHATSGWFKSEGPIGKIIIAVAIALLVGGSSPWWWDKLFTKQHTEEEKRAQPTKVMQPECSPDIFRSQLLHAGTDKPVVIKSRARTMQVKFSFQDLDCVSGLAEVFIEVDQANGHGLYFLGEMWRVKAKQDPSHADFYRERMREYFFRYIATEPSLALSERKGYAAACYLREKGYCAERTAWINHLMAIDFYQQGHEATNKKIKLKRFERASEFVEKDLKFKQKDSTQNGFEQIYPSKVLKGMIQAELQLLQE